jgi:hypothetical protein
VKVPSFLRHKEIALHNITVKIVTAKKDDFPVLKKEEWDEEDLIKWILEN